MLDRTVYIANLQQGRHPAVEVLGSWRGLVVSGRSSRRKGPRVGAAAQRLCHVDALPALRGKQSSALAPVTCIALMRQGIGALTGHGTTARST
jgi:hypothetical protein